MTPDPFLSDIFAPTVVAVPPADAVSDLCRTADGEIRHYGWQMLGGEKRRVYIASRDEGLSWKTFLAADGSAGAMERSPESGDWIGFEKGPTDSGEGHASLYLLRSKTGPGDPAPLRERLPWNGHFVRQFLHLRTRRRWIAALSDTRCENGAGYRAAVALSDDDGRSWHRSAMAFEGGDEAKFIQLNDGRLLISVRRNGARGYNHSADDGESWGAQGTWPEMTVNACNGELLRLDDSTILHSITNSLQRENVSIFFSTDEGASWHTPVTLFAGPSVYSSMTLLPDGTIAAYVELNPEGPCELWYMHFNRKWLEMKMH